MDQKDDLNLIVQLWRGSNQCPPEVGHAEALRRIEACREEGKRVLDLRGLKLPEIPPEVGGLADLRMLFLSGNKIKDLASLSGLTDLQSLWLQNNEIKDLVPLGGLLFDNVLFDIDWITTAVYGITENQAIIKRNGRFTREEIIAVWANKGVTDRSDH